MTLTALTCPGCGAALAGDPAPLGSPAPCPRCRRDTEGVIFPALRRPPPTGKTAEIVVSSEEAACFYHPHSRAQVACDRCGRFLCALCDLPLDGGHLCPPCVETGGRKRAIASIDGQRILFGGIALLVAVVPVVGMWYVTIATGPLAVFLALYGYSRPRSLVGTGRVATVLAIVLGLAQIAVWVWLIVALVTGGRGK